LVYDFNIQQIIVVDYIIIHAVFLFLEEFN